MRQFKLLSTLLAVVVLPATVSAADAAKTFVSQFCSDCHGKTTQEATLDLTSLPRDFGNPDHFRRWVKVHDRIAAGEMPPKDAAQPDAAQRTAFLKSLGESLIAAERAKANDIPKLRRLTRAEYENTIRDLFDMPGIALAGNLPADGSAHGFDKHAEALDISHVNVKKYLEAADHILNYAIATRPQPPNIQRRRISLVNRGGFVAHVVMNGDGVLLKNKLPDPEFPPAGDQNHLDQGAHERWGSFRNGASVGLFRHEDESFNPYFIEHVTVYPARYRVRTSLWSFQWDKGKVLPGRGTEAARLSVVQLTGDGRGGQHPSYVLGYFDAPAEKPREHELVVWLNHNEMMGLNTASLAPVANYSRKGRAMAFTGPGIAIDWIDVEGPLYESWPPKSHKLLFGDLPLTEFKVADHPGVRPPRRLRVRQLGAGQNRPDPSLGLWTVQSEAALKDAERLLAKFLPKLFRSPVAEEVRREYVALVKERLDAGDCFETAMRAAYRNAMVAPDFLYHVETQDDDALACRLSYFLWNSLPDEQLRQHAAAGNLRQPKVLHAEIARLLQHPNSQRFIEDFLGQWLKLRQIAATDPDRKLYPEFSPYLQDSMVAETRAYFRELLDKDLDASHLVKSPFVMINEKLATHYGIAGVSGSRIRNVSLPENCPRGGFLTQAAILKITANGTTTSPVPRGAFVMDRILGQPPEPPPANIAAIEPDVRGATTIREQLKKHRNHAVCASCHKQLDPPGFALESFDVIGGLRSRYRSIGEGDPAERGLIDPFIGISFKLGQPVETAGQLADGRAFKDITQYQSLIAADSTRLLRNLAQQFTVYSTGHTVRFSDRPALEEIVRRTQAQGGGIRTLLHEVIGSPLFTGEEKTIVRPAGKQKPSLLADNPYRMMMRTTLPQVTAPIIAKTSPAPTKEATVGDFQFDDAHTVNLQVAGLFMADRVDDFRKVIQQFPEAKLLKIDFKTAQTDLAYAADSDLFRGAKPEQIVERLNNRVRQLSGYTLAVRPLSAIPRDKLSHIEIPIIGLDCKACSMAVYDILARIEGVEQATASFRDGRATAWIDPNKTNRSVLEETLKKRGVQLKLP
jgi:copper chaperone CopZ